MAKQGYFSGKSEYEKQQNNRNGSYKRQNGSDTRGYSKSKGGYGDQQTGERKPYYGNKPQGGNRSYGDQQNGERKPYYGNKPQGGNHSYGDQQNGERKPYYGNKPQGGNRSYGDQQTGERKPYYGNKPQGGNRSYGDQQTGERKPYHGNKPQGGNRSYSDQQNGERKPYRGKPYDDTRKPYERPRDTGVQPAEQPEAQQGGEDELPFLIIGRNAVREAVRSGRSIDRILVSAEPDGSLREIIGYAKDVKIQVRETARKALDELCMPFGHGGKTANHQGIVAYAAGVEYCDVSDILDCAKARGEQPFVIVLDGIMDPHNLGSIIRSAECAGAHGVIIGKRRSASVSAATVKASAGAIEHMHIARVTNIPAAIKELKKAGVWIAGADMAGKPMEKQALDGAIALVIGNEGEGLGKLVTDTCDFLVSIPLFGQIDSLNASVAAGILMFEKKRQDAAKA